MSFLQLKATPSTLRRKWKSVLGVSVTIVLLAVVILPTPTNAMSIQISPNPGTFVTPAVAVFHIRLDLASVERVPIQSLEAIISGGGLPLPISVMLQPTHSVNHNPGVQPFILLVSASAFDSKTQYGSLYGYAGSGFQYGYGSGSGYGYGYGGISGNQYVVMIDTTSLVHLASLSPGSTGTFTFQVIVHTSLTSGTSNFPSVPVPFTVRYAGLGPHSVHDFSCSSTGPDTSSADPSIVVTFSSGCGPSFPGRHVITSDYSGIPFGSVPAGVSALKFFDVQVAGFDSSGTVTISVTDAGLPFLSNAHLYYWTGSSWVSFGSVTGSTATGTLPVSLLQATPMFVGGISSGGGGGGGTTTTTTSTTPASTSTVTTSSTATTTATPTTTTTQTSTAPTTTTTITSTAPTTPTTTATQPTTTTSVTTSTSTTTAPPISHLLGLSDLDLAILIVLVIAIVIIVIYAVIRSRSGST